MKTIYLITMHEHADNISFGASFEPEAYVDPQEAERRYEALSRELSEGAGVYYTLAEIELH